MIEKLSPEVQRHRGLAKGIQTKMARYKTRVAQSRKEDEEHRLKMLKLLEEFNKLSPTERKRKYEL